MYWASFLILFTLGAGPFSADTWLEDTPTGKQHKKKWKSCHPELFIELIERFGSTIETVDVHL